MLTNHTTITATDEPGLRVVATLSRLVVDGATYINVEVDEPLTRDTALELAARLTLAANTIAA